MGGWWWWWVWVGEWRLVCGVCVCGGVWGSSARRRRLVGARSARRLDGRGAVVERDEKSLFLVGAGVVHDSDDFVAKSHRDVRRASWHPPGDRREERDKITGLGHRDEHFKRRTRLWPIRLTSPLDTARKLGVGLYVFVADTAATGILDAIAAM